MDIVGLISGTGAILGGIVSVIEQTTEAWDRTKNGKKYLDSVVIQIKITREILEKFVKVETDLQSMPEVYSAVGLVKEKALELETAVNDLIKSSGDGGSLKVFLSEIFQGNARAKIFDRLQRDLYQAQTILITSLVANRVSNTNIFHVNINTVNKVKECFTQCEGPNCAPAIIQLLNEKGKPVGDGTVWQISEEDLEAFLKESQSSEPQTVRIVENNKLKDLAFITADVGNPGKTAPKVDVVKATGNELSGSALIIAGPVTFETAAKMQIVREALPVLRTEKEEALKVLRKWY
ncbi:hypothetical protein F5B21DRAFT_75661 [Xylaria acuta]|nr:hypothetical protein F5B21DRAFT_75661 [Xylaria acuta]